MPKSTSTELSHVTLASALGNDMRWRILAALFNHEALPTTQIASLVGEERSRLSKHLYLMAKLGVIEHWHGKLYRIPHHFRGSSGDTLDYGCAIIRVDRIK